MQEAENLSSQEKEHLAGEIMDSLGEPKEAADVINDPNVAIHRADEKDDLPLVAKERLGRQEKRHKKELRAMQEQLTAMQAHLGSPNQPVSNFEQPVNPYTTPAYNPGSVNDHMQVIANYAQQQQQKEMQQQRMQEAYKQAQMQKLHQGLQNNLDKGSDKYDDFDDVVRAPDAAFTPAMRDAAMILPHENAHEVLYKLAKNPDELNRIGRLLPHEQAREMMKLSVALKDGNGSSPVKTANTMGSLKSNPVSSSSVSDTTSVSELRKRMKAGSKWGT